jgi:hypothetical protein
MRKDLTTDSTQPSDWTLSKETDERLDRSSVRTGHMPPAKSMRLLRLPKVMQQTGLKKTKLCCAPAPGLPPASCWQTAPRIHSGK